MTWDIRVLGLFVAIGFAAAGAACSRSQLGLPRMPLSLVSPDGRFVAFVRNHPDIDPPSQSIWVGPVNGGATMVKRLGADMDWCNTIVWSADSSTVSFLVQDAKLVTADARQVRMISEQWLTDWKGEYPPARMAQQLSLSARGHTVNFRDCRRVSGTWRPGYFFDAADCGAMRAVAIRAAP